MRRAIALISPEILKEALKLPAGTTITGAEWDLTSNCVRLGVSHESFADIPDEYHAPLVRLAIKSEWR